ncbi:MAG: ubiquinone biosynthesis regulatory protein kinase UbiB [Chromatiales bacterium]
MRAPLGQMVRLVTINAVLVRHGLDELIFAIHLLRPLRFLLYLLPWNWFRRRRAPRGQRIREAAEDLGPVFVKFGQMLSTRRDLLPDDIADELAKLQDRVPPFPGSQAREIVERAYGRPLDQVFATFDEHPMASASIAQVHSARLEDGTEVVVKVVRPAIERTIRRDLDLLYIVADLARRYWPEARRLRPVEVVQEYEKAIIDELDLVREAANASLIRRNFAGSRIVYIPEVYWDYTRRDVMVMERIYGTPISDIATLRERGVDLRKLAERGVEIFFTQVFRHNFFHADMHPGNIFVAPGDPDDPQYIAVDYGIVGSLSPSDQRYLAENFHAFFNRDYRRVAELHVESGWVPPETRVDEFESAIRTVSEPIFERPLDEISFGNLLLNLFQTARRFDMVIQPQLVLLQKTLLNIEGLGRDLYPDLDLWRTAKPFMQRWMDERIGVRALLQGARKNLPLLLEKLPSTPGLLHDVLDQGANGRLRLQWQSEQLEALRSEIRAGHRRGLLAITGVGLLVSGFVAIGMDWEPRFLSIPWPSWLLWIGAAALLGNAWYRSG